MVLAYCAAKFQLACFKLNVFQSSMRQGPGKYRLNLYKPQIKNEGTKNNIRKASHSPHNLWHRITNSEDIFSTERDVAFHKTYHMKFSKKIKPATHAIFIPFMAERGQREKIQYFFHEMTVLLKPLKGKIQVFIWKYCIFHTEVQNIVDVIV